MRPALAGAVLLIFGLPASLGIWQRESAVRDAEQHVTALEQRWLENEDNPEVLESILADDFVHVLPLGFVTKREQIDYMRQHPQTRCLAKFHPGREIGAILELKAVLQGFFDWVEIFLDHAE